MTEDYKDWPTERLELAIEYRERVLLGEIQRDITVEYLHEFGAMCVELSKREAENGDKI